MFDAIRYATAAYRNELARRVQAIGYRIRPARHGFEIEGVSDAVLRQFCKRAQERDKMVRQMEQELGRKLSNNEVAYAVHRTRGRKVKGISSAEVRERQQAQLSAGDLQSLRELTASAQMGRPTPAEGYEQEALAYATAHVFERQSVVPEYELLAAALSHHPGEMSISRGRERCQVFTDDLDRLRSHVTHSSERLAAVEVVPHVRQKFIQRVMERGHRFLKHFRQRITQSHSFRKSIEQIRESSYEHQHKPRRSIRV